MIGQRAAEFLRVKNPINLMTELVLSKNCSHLIFSPSFIRFDTVYPRCFCMLELRNVSRSSQAVCLRIGAWRWHHQGGRRVRCDILTGMIGKIPAGYQWQPRNFTPRLEGAFSSSNGTGTLIWDFFLGESVTNNRTDGQESKENQEKRTQTP